MIAGKLFHSLVVLTKNELKWLEWETLVLGKAKKGSTIDIYKLKCRLKLEIWTPAGKYRELELAIEVFCIDFLWSSGHPHSLVPGVKEECLVYTDALPVWMALLTFVTFTLFRGMCSGEIYAVNVPTWK